jgi:hypothetical protein
MNLQILPLIRHLWVFYTNESLFQSGNLPVLSERFSFSIRRKLHVVDKIGKYSLQ